MLNSVYLAILQICTVVIVTVNLFHYLLLFSLYAKFIYLFRNMQHNFNVQLEA